MNIADDVTERVDAYKILAELFSKAPDKEKLGGIREDLELESKESEHEILEDFSQLISYPGGKLPPVESLFLTQSWGTPAAPVMQIYAEAGLKIGDEFMTVPDHVSLEFLFMSHLVSTRNLDLQGRFLEEHLVNWVPYYCETLKKETRTLFYKEIARMTVAFIEREYDGFE